MDKKEAAKYLYSIIDETGKINKITIDSILNNKLEKNILTACKVLNLTITANGFLYRKDKKGFLTALMEDLFEKRKVYKNKMIELEKEYERTKDEAVKYESTKYKNFQMAIKIKLNSCYGALANAYFRWNDIDLAESITMSGQLTIQYAEKKLNEYLNQLADNIKEKDYCITADTDSLYLKMEDFIPNKDIPTAIKFIDDLNETKIQPYLNKIYQDLADSMNAYKQAMSMKREIIANRAIFVAKKRYIANVWNKEGVQYSEPELKMMGIEAVRSSTPSACRDAIEELLKVIMNKTENDMRDYIGSFRAKFKTLPFEDISFPRGLNASLDEYRDSVHIYKKSTPIHVRGALLYNKIVHDKSLKINTIKDKEKIKFCYLKLPNPIGENVISVPMYLEEAMGLNEYIDYDTQFEKSFLDPVRNILDSIGWSIEKRNTLQGFLRNAKRS